MTRLDELDGGRRLRFVDLERELWRAQELVLEVSIEELRKATVVVAPDGRALRGFFAIPELSKRLAVLWVWVPVMYAPGAEWVGTRVYAWVARGERGEPRQSR